MPNNSDRSSPKRVALVDQYGDDLLNEGSVPVSVVASVDSEVLAQIKAKTDNLDIPLSEVSVGSGGSGGGLTNTQLRAAAVLVTSNDPQIFAGLTDDELRATPVSVSGFVTAAITNYPATQPVSAASLPLPSGASTETTLAAIKAKTDNLDVALSTVLTDTQLRASAVPVSGTFYPATQPVSAAALPLPSGAATETTLAAIKAKTDNLDVALSTRAVTGLTDTQLRATAVPVAGPLTDAQLRTSAVPVSGTFFQATQPVSASSLPLPSGASTETTLALIKAKTDNLDVALSTRAVTGLTDTQLRASAVPVSAAALPLPSGASTEATLAGIKTGTDKIPASPAAEHTTALSPNAARLSDGAAFYKATTPSDTQPVSAASLPLPSGASTETTLAAIKAKTDNLDVALSTRAVTGLTDTQLRATAVPVSGTFFQGTQPVSAASLPLPTGASTEATLALIKAKTDNLDVALSTRAVTGLTDTQLRASAVPVSAASLPLPSGAATAAKQPALGTAGSASADVITIQGVASMTPVKTDGSGVTQPVSAASLPLPTGAATQTTLAAIAAQLPAALVGARLDVNLGTALPAAAAISNSPLGSVSLGNSLGKTAVMKTGSLASSATTADQVILTYTVTALKTFYLEYFDLVARLTTFATTATLFGTCSLEIVAGTKMYTTDLMSAGPMVPVRVEFAEPIPVAAGTVIRIVCTPSASTAMTWKGNFGGYEK